MQKRHVEYNSTKVNLIIGVISLLLIGLVTVLVMTSPTNQSSASNPSILQAVESEWDFGTISMAKGDVVKTYTVKNNSTSTITVNKVYTSCMCTKATLNIGDRRAGPFGMPGHATIPTINEMIPPGAEATIEVVFNPAAHGPSGVGTIARTVFVESTDGGKLSLNFKAQVTP